SVAVRKFARFLSLLRSELPNQSDTSNFMVLVSLWTRSSQSRLLSSRANFGSGTLSQAQARETTDSICAARHETTMQFGICTPLPHTIRPEARMDAAVAKIKSPAPLDGEPDDTFGFACDVVRRADELGFDTTLIAERYLGPDLSAWVLASALAMVTKRIE